MALNIWERFKNWIVSIVMSRRIDNSAPNPLPNIPVVANPILPTAQNSQEPERENNMHYYWEEEIVFTSGRRIAIRFKWRDKDGNCINYKEDGANKTIFSIVPLKNIEYTNLLTMTAVEGEEPYGVFEDSLTAKPVKEVKPAEPNNRLGEVE